MSNSTPTPNHNPTIRQKMGIDVTVKSFSLTDSTIQGLESIQKSFCVRYPTERYPTLSLVLEQVLAKCAKELDADPEWFAEEVRIFQTKYGKPKS